jgi:hypothetical protein
MSDGDAIATQTDLSEFLGSPPLISGEIATSYEGLLARVKSAVRPRDFIEEIWLRDFVALSWEAVRLRRLKASLLVASAHQGMQKLLDGVGCPTSYSSARDWAARDEQTVKDIETAFAVTGFGPDAVMACTLAARIEDVERIDRMAIAAELRRNAILQEIDRHRASWVQGLRRTLDDLEAHDLRMISSYRAPAVDPA